MHQSLSSLDDPIEDQRITKRNVYAESNAAN